MAENVYEILKSNHPQLVADVLDKHEELCSFLFLVYSHTLVTTVKMAKEPSSAVLTTDIMDDRLLRVKLTYDPSKEGRRVFVTDAPLRSQRNLSLVNLLQVNVSVKNVALDVVRILERWVNEKPFRRTQGLFKVRLEYPMFWKNLIFTAELVTKFEFDEMVRAKMKWTGEEELNEQAATEGGVIIP